MQVVRETKSYQIQGSCGWKILKGAFKVRRLGITDPIQLCHFTVEETEVHFPQGEGGGICQVL